MTMGTASTMTSAAEALGLTLPGAASIPAADSRHGRMAAETGRRIVDMVWEDLKPRDFLTAAAIDNAITTVLALGGSTNAVVHLIAMARRAGVALSIDRFDALARRTPLVANIRPAGKYLMEDFYYAGGLRALLAEIGDLLDLDARTVNGKTLGENIAGAEVFNHDVILPRDKRAGRARQPRGAARQSRAGRRGDQAGGGRAASAAAHRARGGVRRLQRHGGAHRRSRAAGDEGFGARAAERRPARRARACRNGASCRSRRSCSPQGVRDMVRISDARMSGTSYGACVLHVAPESFIGGPLALVQDGDLIELDVAARKLELKVSDAELARRRAAWKRPAPRYERGYGALYQQHITQADQGCDFDFLEGTAPTRGTGNPLKRCASIPAAKLVTLVAAIMEGGGCSADEARTVARRLVDSNLVGHDSHGVLRVGQVSRMGARRHAEAEHAADRSCSTATRSRSSTAIAASAR